MKSKISQAAKKSVSLLLAILMMFSMLTVAMTVTVNAATDGVFKKDELFYFDFSAIKDQGVNVNETNFNNKWDFSSNDLKALTDGILPTSIKSDTVDLSSKSDTLLFRSAYTGYQGVRANNASNTWTSGNNMVVAEAGGKSFRWATYGSTATTEYTVTVGSTTGGSISGVATGDKFAKDATVSFTVTASESYQVGTVTVTKTTDNSQVEVTNNNDGTYSFQMPASNVTIDATFTSTATSALTELYFYQNSGSGNLADRHFALMDKAGSNFKIATTFPYNFKFKLVSSQDTSKNPVVEDSSDYSVSRRSGFSSSKVSFSDSLLNASASASVDTTYYDITFNKGNSEATEFVVEYIPDGDTGLDGTIKIWTETEYVLTHGSTSGLTLSQTTASLVVGGTVTLTATHKDGCTTNAVKFESDNESVATVDDTGLVTAVANGKATITATCENCGSATCTVTVAAPVLKTPKIKADAYVYPGSKVTVALDNQKDFGTANETNSKKYDNVKNVSFEYTVTPSVNTTATSTGKLLQTDGSGSNTLDSIEFTASQNEGTSYKIKVTASADGFTSATSAEITVTVSKIPFKTANRIYAYAGAIADGSTPALNSWVAAETKTSTKLEVYSNRGKDGGQVVNYPNLGSSDATDLRIFLPSSVTGDTVALFNSYSESLVVTGAAADGGNVTIAPNSYGNVKFTDDKALNITIGSAAKTLTLYKSDADSAVYLNHTSTDYAGVNTSNNVPKMIEQLYTNKDTGALDSDNYGAVADSKGIKDVAVKKIKGRGNTTWKYTDKKSFNVSYSSAVKIGNVTSKKFSFLANYKDPSLSRNRILYALGDYMGVTYSPDVATVDLYMNGLYMGAYLACEKVDVGSNTLISDITELDVDNATVESIANGFDFVMELDTSPASDDYAIELGPNKYLTMKTPEYFSSDLGTAYSKNVDDAIKAYIKDKYEKLKTALEGSDKAALENIIDIDSLAKFYLLNELAKNCDIGVASTYFTFKNGKFYASPVWDLDMTAANGSKGDTYADYEGNWSAYNNNLNVIMKAAFNNAYVQSAARKIWVESYYTNLTKELTITGKGTTIADKALNNKKALENNFTKWTYPIGFNGDYGDDIKFRTQLTTASYDVGNHSYSKASSSTAYSDDYEGQIKFVLDWLKSRAAWMTKKYNTYTVGGLKDWSSDGDKQDMQNKGDGTHILTFTSNVNSQHGIKIYSDATITNGIDTPRDKSHACITYDASVQVIDNSDNGTISAATAVGGNIALNVTATADAPVYLIYDQVKNTVTLSDTKTTSSNPTVALKGSTVKNEDIKDGTSVTLTATVTPATNNNEVVAGVYTVTLYRGSVKVGEPQTVTFANTDTATTEKQVSFNTTLASANDSFRVVVTKDSYSVTSASVVYKQSGLKDKKIYFDPSGNDAWKGKIEAETIVNVTVKDNSGTNTLATFEMAIDTDDIHGLDKGVFRALVNEETLAKLQNPSNKITFALSGDNVTVTADGNESVTDGWIYTSTSEIDNKGNPKPSIWAQYNTKYTEAYPKLGIENYQQFENYLKEQYELYKKGEPTDNIVYFDNSVSQWYNVYIYGWSNTGMGDNTREMKKLPYADIWYYDFGDITPTSEFLFKDRSGETFGTDYQQTVDLVDGTVRNGNDENVNIYFAETLSIRANPIFITANFYSCTIQGASSIVGTDANNTLKFRAFNTEWKEFYTVATNTVKTTAVDVYFDLHSNKAKDIQLYHESTNDGYSMTTDFTRLTQLGNSNIYYAKMKLPYTTTNGNINIAFKFTKFIVDNADGSSTTYAMSQYVQPKSDCITTGEVWYEFGENITRPTTSTSLTSTGASAKTALYASTGASVSTVSTGAADYTFYIIPALCNGTDSTGAEYNFTQYVDENGELTKIPDGNELFVRVQHGSNNNNSSDWKSCVTTKDSRTIGGKAVYSATVSLDNPYLYSLYYKIGDRSSDKALTNSTCRTFKTTQTSTDIFSGKVWNGSSWVEPVWDTVATPSITSFTVNSSNTAEITLSDGSASVLLAISTSNAGDNTPTYAITKAGVEVPETVAKIDGTTFIAYEAGTYTVTASLAGASETKSVEITVNEPTPVVNNYFFYQYTGSEPHDHYYLMSGESKIEGTYIYETGSVNNNKFKITSSNDVDSAPKDSPYYSVSKRDGFDASKIEFVGFTNASASLSNISLSDTYNDIVIDLGDYALSDTNKIVIEYTPGGNTGLDGSIKIYSYAAYYGPQPTQSITLNATATSIDLASGNLTSTITATLNGDLTGNVTFTVTDPSGTDVTSTLLSSNGTTATFTANSSTKTGTYTIKATVGNVEETITIVVTNSSSSDPVTDNCGILGYKHSTATFESTTGGKIDSVNVILNGGYNIAGDYSTGYATTTDGVTTVIYAIVTEKSDAKTSYSSTTRNTDGNYKFNGWTKDGNVITDGTEKNLSITELVANNTATVSYVANWSQVKEVTYTFEYNYKEYDTSLGREYKSDRERVDATPYTVKVNIKEITNVDELSDAVKAEILALFKDRAPILSSDYFNYTFEHLEFGDLKINVGEKRISGSAKIIGDAKTYSVTLKEAISGNSPDDSSGITLEQTSYYYQNVVKVTYANPNDDNTIVWKNDDTGAVLGYGNTLLYRITKNITISYEEVPKTSIEDKTVVNAPTYEFYTSGSTQKVRFNFFVENFVASDTTVAEYGVLYFFTDSEGAPVDKTIAQDKNISSDTLELAAKGGVDGIKRKVIDSNKVNNRKQYIYAPSLSNTVANTDRYLRVFSYFKKADGTLVISDADSVVLGSIRDAIS